MSVGISKLFDDAKAFIDQGRLTPAVHALEEARRLTKIPDRRAWATCSLGMFHWHSFGDGVAARREFLAAAADFDTHGYGQHPQLRLIHAAAIENAMLCALSFDEFEDLAKQLRALTADMPILAGLVPTVREKHEHGEPWSDILLNLAYSCYNRNDPKLDRGRYGQAKSTYHLLLSHRRELRLGRNDWGLVVFEYCALGERMLVDCMIVRGGDADRHSPEEFLPILTDALPLVDEYLAVQSGDERMRKTRTDMQSMIDNARNRWEEFSRPPMKMSSRRVRCPQCERLINPIYPCPSCGSGIQLLYSRPTPTVQGAVFNLLMLLSPLIGLGLGQMIGGWRSPVVGLFAGMLVGVIGLSWFFFVKGVRGMKCEACGRSLRKAPQNPPWMDIPGAMISREALMDASQGPGYECKKCNRTYCSDCQPIGGGGGCKCGSRQFRTVRLMYK